jgi:hypothetical protein
MPLNLAKKRAARRRRGLRPFTVLRCPMNGHQVSPCRGLCTPIDGHGHCGRVAYHSMIGRTQAAIISYNKRKNLRLK